jgi:hypothetical protein
MTNPMQLVRSYGIGVRFADLGDWGEHELRSEYDPKIPEIRINLRLACRLHGDELSKFVALAIGHELYHHREAIGEIGVLSNRSAREAAADAYARRLAEPSR